MSKNDTTKPIRASNTTKRRHGFIRRAPVENLFWEPTTPEQLGEALATIIASIPSKSVSWFWQEMTRSPKKGGVISEGEGIRESVDMHVSMYPGGSAPFTPQQDEWWRDDYIEDAERVPAHMRDFRNAMIRRPDLPLALPTDYRSPDGTSSISNTTSELTAIAYEYGANVPKSMIGSVWNRAQTLMGQALVQPEWIYDPEGLTGMHEGLLLGDPVTGEEREWPVSVRSEVANLNNFISVSRLPDQGGVVSESDNKVKTVKNNKRNAARRKAILENRLKRIWLDLKEDYKVDNPFLDPPGADLMPFADKDEEDVDLDYFGDTDGDFDASEEEVDKLSGMKQVQQFLGTDSTIKVIQLVGRIMGKTLMLMGDKAKDDLDPLIQYAAEQFLDTIEGSGAFSKKDVKTLRENPDLVSEMDSFKYFLDEAFLNPAYLRWRRDTIKAVESSLAKAGIDEKTTKKIAGRIQRAEVFSAESGYREMGGSQEGLFRALGGPGASGQQKAKLHNLSRRIWDIIQQTQVEDLFSASKARWEGIDAKNRIKLLQKSFELANEDASEE